MARWRAQWERNVEMSKLKKRQKEVEEERARKAEERAK